MDSQPLVAELAGYISSEVNRLNALVVRFLDFARPSKLELRPENISEIVDRALEAASASFPNSKVKIERQYAPGLAGNSSGPPAVRTGFCQSDHQRISGHGWAWRASGPDAAAFDCSRRSQTENPVFA